MATRTAIFVLLVYLFKLTSAYIIIDDNDDIDEKFSLVSEYNIKVEIIDLISGIKTPMELWYSSEYTRSRVDVDVHYGTVRRYYYLGDDKNTTKTYMVYPRTDDKQKVEMVCGPSEDSPSDVFPFAVDYVYTGNTAHEGKEVDVWEYKQEGEDEGFHVVLYSYRTNQGDVPVQIVRKKYNTLKGTTDAHDILNYYNYEPEFDAEDIEPEKDSVCNPADTFHGHMRVLHPAFNGDLDIAFNSFKKHHKKDYKNTKEHDMRKEIFHKNWLFVEAHNRQHLGYKLAMNHLSDLTPAERRRMNGARSSPHPSATISFPHSEEEVRRMVTELPEEFDLRLEGVISPIKNQGDCGSCWAFATTATVEGSLARLDGRILDLSEQSIIDCNWSNNNEGCNGGNNEEALRYVVKHGVPMEEDYGGYLAENGFCHLQNATELFRIRGFTLVTPYSENAMKVALHKYGPVVVSMETNDAFGFYSSGVYYDVTCSPEHSTDHAVTIVGYGVRDGVNYWIMKNSHGQQWGEDGYMLISTLNNNCHILDAPYYAVV